jgi:hypothetical protein
MRELRADLSLHADRIRASHHTPLPPSPLTTIHLEVMRGGEGEVVEEGERAAMYP